MFGKKKNPELSVIESIDRNLRNWEANPYFESHPTQLANGCEEIIQAVGLHVQQTERLCDLMSKSSNMLKQQNYKLGVQFGELKKLQADLQEVNDNYRSAANEVDQLHEEISRLRHELEILRRQNY